MPLFDEEYLNNLPDDPNFAGYEICQKFMAFIESQRQKLSKTSKPDYEYFLEVYALLETVSEANELEWPLPALQDVDREKIAQEIWESVKETRAQLETYVLKNEEQRKLAELRGQFGASIKKAFVYEFSEGDLKIIQARLNELRALISESQVFDKGHKRRLLKRLEKLQQELHKKLSDLDHFWGLIGDAGVVLGKFGNDAKPIVDRIKEITQIVWAHSI
jgi:polyribonucleotide nucleotidyltransferase